MSRIDNLLGQDQVDAIRNKLFATHSEVAHNPNETDLDWDPDDCDIHDAATLANTKGGDV